MRDEQTPHEIEEDRVGPHRFRLARIFTGVGLVLLLLLLAVAAYQLLRARQHLLAGSQDLRAAVAAVHASPRLGDPHLRAAVHGDLAAGLGQFAGARTDLELWSPFLDHMGWIPVIGGQLTAASPAADASFYATRAAVHLLDGLSAVWPALDHRAAGKTPLLARLAPALSQGRANFLRARSDADGATRALVQMPARSGNASLDAAHARLASILPVVGSATRWLSVGPGALGMNRPVHYLVVFQNPDELHATGGFIGAVDYVTLRRGGITHAFYDSALPRLSLLIPPPAPLGLYTNVAFWQFVYANWSPDFPLTARSERWIYGKGVGNWVDGVINIQDPVIASLLTVTGPVYLPTFHVTVNAGNVAALSQAFVHGRQQGRFHVTQVVGKRFLGVLFKVMIARIQALPTGRWPAVASAIATAVSDRSLLLYDRSSQVEGSIRAANADGMLRYVPGDYLAVVDTNFSDNKLNPYVREWGQYNVTLGHDLWADATLTLHYHVNPSPANVEGPAPGDRLIKSKHDYEDFVRVYVPPGARLVRSTGLAQWAPAPAYGMTQLAGHFIVRQGQTRTVSFHYRIPANALAASSFKRYTLTVRHQPAANLSALQVTVEGAGGIQVGNGPARFSLPTHRDRSLSLPIGGSNQPRTISLPSTSADQDPYIQPSLLQDGKHAF